MAKGERFFVRKETICFYVLKQYNSGKVCSFRVFLLYYYFITNRIF